MGNKRILKNIDEMMSYGHFVFYLITKEAEMNNIKKPKLLISIAYTKYNCGLDVLDARAVLLTSYINNLIVTNYYNDIEFDKGLLETTSNGIEIDIEPFEVRENGNSLNKKRLN